MKFEKIILLSDNLDAQRAFYTTTLGLPLIDDNADSITIQAGWTELTFQKAESPDFGRYHFAFNIPENQYEQAVIWLNARADILTSADDPFKTHFHSENWNADMVYFPDSDGNILELIARHNLDNGAVGPFSSSSILNVSEMGLAAPDVCETVTALEANLGVQVWRGRGSETFSAVGDEDGLLIVVKAGRAWMPDQTVPALPTELQIAAAGLPDFNLPGLPYHFQARVKTTVG